ncbi:MULTISPECIES: cytochrome c [unclassified Paenibacillus]|uniref:c-type cytochrome n=1 Tax=unclassified Paenibacillus TaxID=185978 RepID=UPI001C10FF82|nr:MULTISPECIES: cytochrome c [unclassified Paenibacillus]MBU5442663.1 cytochrome c [Paenibacillus sp. MSJ-34]CAH0122221.1 Cytochrome c-551 [Paenibacillus sp. CECT 9249]
MRKYKLVWVIAAIAALLITVTACGAKSKPPETQTPAPGGETGTPSATVDADAIVKQNCISCHGGNLEGGVGPSLQAVGGKYDRNQIHDIIANGQGGMPPFQDKLSADEISAVADWLAAKK